MAEPGRAKPSGCSKFGVVFERELGRMAYAGRDYGRQGETDA